LFRLPFLHSLPQQGAEKSDMEMLDVTTIRAMGNLCAALGNQHFYVGPIYGHRAHRRMNNCFIHCGVHKLFCFSPDHVSLWPSCGAISGSHGFRRKVLFAEKFCLKRKLEKTDFVWK
jgi:hypothetical protein